MSDWNLPTLGDPYSSFLDALKARDFDAISLGAAFIPAPIVGMMRYDRTANLFQEYIASGWQTKVLSVAGGGTGSSTPAGGIANLGLGTMALQNANNVNISGGAVNGLNALNVNGPVGFAANLGVGGTILAKYIDASDYCIFRANAQVVGQLDCNFLSTVAGIQTQSYLSVAGKATVGSLESLGTTTLNGQVNTNNIRCAQIQATNIISDTDGTINRDLVVNRNLGVVNNISAATIGSTGNMSCYRLDSATLILATTDMYARGGYRAGPGDRLLTNPADGTIVAGQIGYGYGGGGTKVLADNNTWVDMKSIGGGVISIQHFLAHFGEGDTVIPIYISWPAYTGPAAIIASFDQSGIANDSYRFEYVGLNQVNVWKTNPTTLTTNMYFSVTLSRVEG